MDFEEPYGHDGISDEELSMMKNKCEPFFQLESPAHFFVASATLSVYASNQLEEVGGNLTYTTKIINQFVKYPSSLPNYTSLQPEDVQQRREVLQHFQILQAVHRAAKEKIDLTEALIKSWHSQLMDGLLDDAGIYRTDGVFAGHKIFPNPELVSSLMAGLLDEFQYRFRHKSMSPYALAAWMSHAFVSIHPFTDGNGRLSRLLSNYVMWLFGFAFAIPMSTSKKKYIRALRYADKDFEGPRRVGKLATIILKQSNEMVVNYLANEKLVAEFEHSPVSS